MIYFLYAFFIIFILFVIFNYLRKIHWDAIHNNLLDLVDAIGGDVYRRGFLSRPIYHGKFDEHEITINFSLEKSKKGRLNYLDISLGKNFRNSVTVSSLDWLRERGESLDNYHELRKAGFSGYGILKKDLQRVYKGEPDTAFIEILKKLIPFTYLFIGQTGMLFEMECKNFAVCTKHPGLLNKIKILSEVSRIVK